MIEQQYRPVHEIAEEIGRSWKNVYYGAMEYLQLVQRPDAADINIRYFLSSSGRWKGETARRLKQELRDVLTARRRLNKVMAHKPTLSLPKLDSEE